MNDMSSHRRRLWLDTDPGFDDWMAWALLEAHPDIDLLGISVVSGNAPLEITLRNALQIRDFHGWNTPVHAGADRPLGQDRVTAQDVLGEQAMNTVMRRLPQTQSTPNGLDGVGALIDAVRAHPGEVSVLAIGPLTNLALAFERAPDLPDLIHQLIIMGGSTDRGNTTAVAEFNIHADPEAAQLVLGGNSSLERLSIHLFGLNACRQIQVNGNHVMAVRNFGTESAQVFADHLQAYVNISAQRGGQSMAVYDPTPVAWLLHPYLFELSPARVDVELVGQLTRGMTVCEFRVPSKAQANAQVALQANGHAIMEALIPLLKSVLA